MNAIETADSAQVADTSRNDLVCQVRQLHHRYADHVALAGVDYSARAGEISALLGPNGSGKTTLFRLLCTLLPIQEGSVSIDGIDVASGALDVRSRIGIVFQSPSLDKKLTVDENLACQAALYGIHGQQLRQRRDECLEKMELIDRRGDLCESLSGGMRRRVELAKGMLHRPKLMLLDEPSTGLDPAARISLWNALRAMADDGVAVVLTTHLLEEADKADRVSILCDGKCIADGSPATLRGEIGAGVVTVSTAAIEQAEKKLSVELSLTSQRMQNQLRIQSDSPAELVPKIAECLGDLADSISVGRPSLEDVFIAKTGHQFD